jgi:hypothetical protein
LTSGAFVVGDELVVGGAGVGGIGGAMPPAPTGSDLTKVTTASSPHWATTALAASIWSCVQSASCVQTTKPGRQAPFTHIGYQVSRV